MVLLLFGCVLQAQTSYETLKGLRLESSENQQTISLQAPASVTPYALTLPQQLTTGAWTLSIDGATGTSSFVTLPSLVGSQQQVPFFTGASSLTGSPSLLFDSTAKRLTISATSTTASAIRLSRDGSVSAADTMLMLRSTASGGPYRRGLHVELTGTADTSVGIVASVSGATQSYAALFSGRVGINTRAPQTDVDLNGAIAYRQRAHTASSVGPHHNVDFGGSNDRSYVRVAGSLSAASTWTGFAGGTDGKMLMLTNATGKNMVVAHNSTSSSAANRVQTVDGVNW